MMPNIVRGTRMAGLMTYLAGPGRANEHTEPHLVAGDTAMMTWYDDTELGRDSALAIARYLDLPKTAYDVEVNGGHVWHCSLSVRAEEGPLTDDKWNQIATDFVKAMEFDDNEGSKAPCRWVAVRHGLSKNGNDHIHIAVNLVREDGTKASIHHDFRRAQTAARTLETKHGLEELESAKVERATRGFHPAEREAQARARAQAKYERRPGTLGTDAPPWTLLSGEDRQALIRAESRLSQPRDELSLAVRASATASHSEDEFVRRLRRNGLVVRPRFAAGRDDVVTGYSVAMRPQHGERPIWYGGGQLARDLTLPRLRSEWADTPQVASDAVAEWTAASRNRRVVSPGRESTEPTPEMYNKMNVELGALRDQLRSVPLDERGTWARVARDTSGAFAAWSKAVEEVPGPLAATSIALSRSAQTVRRPIEPKRAGTASISGAAMLLASALKGGQGAAAQAIMIRQLASLAGAVHDAAKASGDARQAASILDVDRQHLRAVHSQLKQYADAASRSDSQTQTAVLDPALEDMKRRVSAGQVDANEMKRSGGHPLPNLLEPTRAKLLNKSNQSGIER